MGYARISSIKHTWCSPPHYFEIHLAKKDIQSSNDQGDFFARLDDLLPQNQIVLLCPGVLKLVSSIGLQS